MASLARWRMTRMAPALAAAAAALAVPAAAQASHSPGAPPHASVVPFVSLPGDYPESVTSDRAGNLYLGLFFAGEILKVTPAGHTSPVVTFPGKPGAQSETLGVRVGPDGDLYAAVANTDSAQSGVWAVSPGGRDLHEIASVPGFPNGLAFDKAGNLFVSESIGGAIYRLRHARGPARLWADGRLLQGGTDGVTRCGQHFSKLPIGVNGLAFAGNGDLLAGNTTKATIIRIPVEPDGRAGPAGVFVRQHCRQLWGADGMTTDPRGNLYVAANAAEKIVRVSPAGTVRVLASKAAGDPLYTPSDLAFGPGGQELFGTSFALAYYPDTRYGGVVELPLGSGGPPLR